MWNRDSVCGTAISEITISCPQSSRRLRNSLLRRRGTGLATVQDRLHVAAIAHSDNNHPCFVQYLQLLHNILNLLLVAPALEPMAGAEARRQLLQRRLRQQPVHMSYCPKM